MSEPKDYVYKLPEDYVLEPKMRRKLDVFVGNANLTNVQAQKMVDLHVELVEEYAAAMKDAMYGLALATGVVTFIVAAVIVSTLFIIF